MRIKSNKKRKLDKFTFFLSDASFNNSNKTATGSVINLNTGEQKSFFLKNIQSAMDAEIETLYHSLQLAAKEKWLTPVFINDNRFALQKVKKTFFETDALKFKFQYAQFLWVPREYIYIVDFFTKNLNLSFLEKETEITNDVLHEKIKNVADLYNLDISNLNKKNIACIRTKSKEKIKQEKFQSIKKEIKSLYFLLELKKDIKALEIDEKIIQLESILINIQKIEKEIKELIGIFIV